MADDTWQSKSSGKKPCRACTDFKTWSKQQKQNNTGQSSKSSSPKVTEEAPKPPADCPVDKDQLGRATWTFLHTMAAYYPEAPSTSQQQEMAIMMRTFSKYYPCDYCSHHMREWMNSNPPLTKDRSSFSQWMCSMHNEVNVRLDKPVFDCSKVDERWLHGWKDGSCD